MTPGLRKWHRQVWTAWSAVLPVLVVAAIFAIPKKLPDPQFNNYQPPALPEVVHSAESKELLVRHRSNQITGEHQLELLIKAPLQVPAALVYLSDAPEKKPEEAVFIGSLASQGIYRFKIGTQLENDNSYLLLYDPVKSRVIETMKI